MHVKLSTLHLLHIFCPDMKSDQLLLSSVGVAQIGHFFLPILLFDRPRKWQHSATKIFEKSKFGEHPWKLGKFGNPIIFQSGTKYSHNFYLIDTPVYFACDNWLFSLKSCNGNWFIRNKLSWVKRESRFFLRFSESHWSHPVSILVMEQDLLCRDPRKKAQDRSAADRKIGLHQLACK